MTRSAIALACAVALGACGAQTEEDEARSTTYTAKDADNTARNVRDRDLGDEVDDDELTPTPPNGAGGIPAPETEPPPADQHVDHPTPTDQSNSEADLERTAEIRRRIVDRDTFSLNAKNVKIVTEAGKVTLRGPVDSQAEKDEIERIAREVAGSDVVVSELEIVAPDDDAEDADDADDTEIDVEERTEDADEVR